MLLCYFPSLFYADSAENEVQKKKIKLFNPRNKLGGLKFFGELKILTQPTIFAGVEPILSSSATPRVHYHRGHAYGQLLYASECHHSLSLSLHMLQYPHFRCRTLLLFVFGRSWDFTSCFFFLSEHMHLLIIESKTRIQYIVCTKKANPNKLSPQLQSINYTA